MTYFKKRVKPRQRPTALQEKRFFQVVAIIAVSAFLWLLLAPGSGIMALFSKLSERKKLEYEIDQLKQENEVLQSNIKRLENDPQYLEEVARKEYGFLKKNERIFDFPESDNSEKD